MGPKTIEAEQRTELLRERLQSNSSTSLIFCQELPGHFEKLVVKAVGYECVKNGSEAAVMWRNKSPNEVNDHKQSGGRNEITSKVFLSEKDLLSSISMVKLTTKKKPAISTLVVSYDGQLSGSNEENNYGIFLILVKFLNKVIERNEIDSYIIGGDFRFNTLKFKPPSDVSVLSYETSKESYKSYRNYYFRHSRGSQCEQLIRAIHLENQEAQNTDKKRKNSNGENDEPANQSAKPNKAEQEGKVKEDMSTTPGKFPFQPVSSSWKQRKLKEIIDVTFDGEHVKARAYGKWFDNNKEPTTTQTITGDGNCLFRAFSYVLWGREDHYDELRQLAVNQIKKGRTIVMNPGEYVKNNKMDKDGSWGTHVEIFALSDVLETCIFVYDTTRKSWNPHKHKDLELNTCTSSESECIYLRCTNDNHFDVVLDME